MAANATTGVRAGSRRSPQRLAPTAAPESGSIAGSAPVSASRHSRNSAGTASRLGPGGSITCPQTIRGRDRAAD
jgi:hypothetical protein